MFRCYWQKDPRREENLVYRSKLCKIFWRREIQTERRHLLKSRFNVQEWGQFSSNFSEEIWPLLNILTAVFKEVHETHLIRLSSLMLLCIHIAAANWIDYGLCIKKVRLKFRKLSSMIRLKLWSLRQNTEFLFLQKCLEVSHHKLTQKLNIANHKCSKYPFTILIRTILCLFTFFIMT